MKSFIEEFYTYQCDFCEFIEQTKQYYFLKSRLDDALENLGKTLNGEQTEALNELVSCFTEMEKECEKAGYIKGFKTGVRVGEETFRNN